MGGNQSNFYFVDFEFPKKPAQQTVRKTIGIKQPIQKNGKFLSEFCMLRIRDRRNRSRQAFPMGK